MSPTASSLSSARQTVLAYLSAGDAIEDILSAHPRLEREDILASIEYARRLSAARSTVLLAS